MGWTDQNLGTPIIRNLKSEESSLGLQKPHNLKVDCCRIFPLTLETYILVKKMPLMSLTHPNTSNHGIFQTNSCLPFLFVSHRKQHRKQSVGHRVNTKQICCAEQKLWVTFKQKVHGNYNLSETSWLNFIGHSILQTGNLFVMQISECILFQQHTLKSQITKVTWRNMIMGRGLVHDSY